MHNNTPSRAQQNAWMGFALFAGCCALLVTFEVYSRFGMTVAAIVAAIAIVCLIAPSFRRE